jgi:ribosome biogenesis protein MAK21
MGKKRSKAQNGAKPAFDEAALSKLTAKIETDLANPKPKSNPKVQHQKNERPAKRKRSENDVKDGTPNKRQAQEPKSRPAKPSKNIAKEIKAPKDKKAELLEEILALGGDEDDLDIIAGVDSDVEEGQQQKPKEAPAEMDKALKKELAKFAAGLGFDKVRDKDTATDDEGEEAEEESEAPDDEDEAEGDGWEDEDGDEPETEQEEGVKEPAAEKQSRSAAGKLVSMRHLGQT